MVYAMSDTSDSSFRGKCQHINEEHCSECDGLTSTSDDIHEFVEQASFLLKDGKDEALYLAQHSKEMIQAWRTHQLCTVRQDQSRLEILQNLNIESVFITPHWAMKFLPRKYRESQSDWFGRRGISWHVSVVVRRHSNQLESQGLIHVIQN